VEIYKNIEIEGVNFEHITSLKIEEDINEHATAYVTGILDESSSLEKIHNLGFDSNITIKASEETLFIGLVASVEFKKGSEVSYLSLELKSHSLKLDIERVSRSFQDESIPYTSLFNQVASNHGAIILDTASNGRPQGQFYLQYRETDWKFLKRLASRLEAVIIAHPQSEKPQIAIGKLGGNTHIVSPHNFKMENLVGEYYKSSENFEGWDKLDFIHTTIESKEVYSLCDIIICNGVKYLVAGKINEFKDSMLINKYRLQPLSSFRQNTIYNEELIGLSLDGEVIDVKEDKLQIELEIGEEQGTVKWFDFNTNYVAENHTGTYIMPELCNHIQLYIPDWDEAKCFVKPIIRKDGETNPKTQDPDIKYFETIDGKELMLSPDTLSLTADHGKVYMKLQEPGKNQIGGIYFISDHDIDIKSTKIDMEGEKVNIEVGKAIYMRTESSSLLYDEKNLDGKGIDIADFYAD